ncbi:MAG TPA: hypothetical protein VGL69_20630 [Solirubrobacteraceae bacterium]|jgi:hypothetical protein
MAEPPLKPFEANVTSQAGEDGVIARALELLGERDGWCVEFGAFDGREASNTYSLIASHGYSAVLIESDPVRFASLRATHRDRPAVHTLQRMVGFDGEDSLDRLLADTPAPIDFDLLSIDIDGNDYHAWEAVREYRPKLVVIEFNPTIPNEVDFVQPRAPAVRQGASLTAIARLAREKGYRLVHATTLNGVFVDERYFDRFGVADDSPSALRTDLSLVTWLYQTYDGRLHLSGCDRLLWHDAPLNRRRLQQVPRPLRDFPEQLPKARRLAYRLWRGYRDPAAELRRWTSRIKRPGRS